MARLARTVDNLAEELGGLSRGMSYALENEAYRALPAFFATRYGITVDERFVRTEIDGSEVNLFARGHRNGKLVYIVGETKLQLDERRNNHRAFDSVMRQLKEQVASVQARYPEADIVPVLLTHYARPSFRQRAEEEGIVLIQSFEW